MAIKGVGVGAVALMGGGLIFLWSAIHGASVTGSLRDLLSGQQPPNTNTEGIAATNYSTTVLPSGSGGVVPSVSGDYSHAQLEQLWEAEGGSPSAANMAAAIAQAESGGNPNATNHNTNGSTDRGLWQINSIWGSLSTYDPSANAKAAIQISGNGSNWSPWTTYNTGAYHQFLQ